VGWFGVSTAADLESGAIPTHGEVTWSIGEEWPYES
jgi:hypothetical protein